MEPRHGAWNRKRVARLPISGPLRETSPREATTPRAGVAIDAATAIAFDCDPASRRRPALVCEASPSPTDTRARYRLNHDQRDQGRVLRGSSIRSALLLFMRPVRRTPAHGVQGGVRANVVAEGGALLIVQTRGCALLLWLRSVRAPSSRRLFSVTQRDPALSMKHSRGAPVMVTPA